MLELKKASREQRVIVPGMQRHPQLCGEKCPGAAGAHSQPRVELREGGAEMGKGKMGFTADTLLLSPRLQSQRARFRKDLETEGFKQGLREKSANFRRWIEELLQARKAALSYGLKFEQPSVRPSKVITAAKTREQRLHREVEIQHHSGK